MSYQGINPEKVKHNNRSAVLKILNDHGQMARKDVAELLGLTQASVTQICNDLLAEGCIVEMGEQEEAKRSGRKKILLSINYDQYQVVCINLEVENTTVSICNLKGQNRQSAQLKTDKSSEPAAFLNQVANTVKSLMWDMNLSKEQILGVGVSVPGVVDRATGMAVNAYSIWEEPVNVEAILNEALGLPIILENNVLSFAEAELVYGHGQTNDNLLFVKWGPGVGAAIVIGKSIYESNKAKTAEIGHTYVSGNKLKCGCGKVGCLETLLSSSALASQTEEQRTESINHFAEAVVNSVTMLAPEKVVVYGNSFKKPGYYDSFTNRCKELSPLCDADYIKTSDLAEEIEYIGPLAVVVNRCFLDPK